MLVDFAGDTVDIFDPVTGEVRAMKLFVEAMGASNYTYAEACPGECTELFAEIDRLKLGELPDQPYVFARLTRLPVRPKA